MVFHAVVEFVGHILDIKDIFIVVDGLFIVSFLQLFASAFCLPEELPKPANCPGANSGCQAVHPSTGYKTTATPN